MASLLSKGVLVQVCPYQANRSFHYLAALDGVQGRVQQIRGHGEKCSAVVDLKSKGHSGPMEMPAAALKPVEGA